MFLSNNLIEYAWPAVAPQQNNGNLYRQDHFVPTALDGDGNVTAWVMSADYYCYDSLNRVAQIGEETYTSAGGYTPNVFNQQFSFDRFGNRLVSSATGTGAPNPGYKINGANNRLIAPTDADGSQASDKMRYDVSGNLIKDTHTQMGTTGNRTYDAENRMLTADGANGLANSYAYDADGQRTRRSINNGGEIWWQVYGISGELVAEYQLISGTPTLKKEYGYRNGQLLVIAETTGTCQWVVTDALGTPRIIADQTGSLAGMKRRDYLPFGEELLAGVGHRQPTNGYSISQSLELRQQFTGKERDSETGLDYFLARYYSSTQGRFTSPDEFTGGPDELYNFASAASDNPTFYADLATPQSLNKYQYTYNNPLRYTDVDGHCWPFCQDLAGGILKSVANAGIDIENTGRKYVTGQAPVEYYQPSTEAEAAVMGTTDKLLILGSFLGGRAPANVAVAEAKQTAAVAAEAGATNLTSNAARRASMREAGIPTSQQPLPASQQIGPRTTAQGKNYEYDVPGKGRMAVQQTAKPGPNEPHGPHWEAGKIKTEVRQDPLGRPRLQNDKSRVEYRPKKKNNEE